MTAALSLWFAHLIAWLIGLPPIEGVRQCARVMAGELRSALIDPDTGAATPHLDDAQLITCADALDLVETMVSHLTWICAHERAGLRSRRRPKPRVRHIRRTAPNQAALIGRLIQLEQRLANADAFAERMARSFSTADAPEAVPASGPVGPATAQEAPVLSTALRHAARGLARLARALREALIAKSLDLAGG